MISVFLSITDPECLNRSRSEWRVDISSKRPKSCPLFLHMTLCNSSKLPWSGQCRAVVVYFVFSSEVSCLHCCCKSNSISNRRFFRSLRAAVFLLAATMNHIIAGYLHVSFMQMVPLMPTQDAMIVRSGKMNSPGQPVASARALMSTTTVGVRSAKSKQLLWTLSNLLWNDVAIICIKYKELGKLIMNIAACACASLKMYLTVSCLQRVGVAISAANFVDEEFNKQLLWRFSLTIHKKRFCRFIVSFELFTRPLLCYVYPGACSSIILSN